VRAPACVSRAPSVDTVRSSLTVVEEVYLMSCFCLSQAKVVPEDSVDSSVGGSRAAVTLSEAPGQLLKSEDISDSHPEELLCRYDDISTWFRITVLGCCRPWPGSPPRFPT